MLVMDAEKIKKLIGIPWGEADCLSLSISAHQALTGKILHIKEPIEWTEENIEKRSQEIMQHISEYADQVETPGIGDVGIMRMCGGLHMYTVVDPTLVLHIKRNGKSCLHQFSAAIRNRTISYWHWR